MRTEQGQCLIDIALQHAGSLSALFLIANANGLSVTDDIAPGAKLQTVAAVESRLVNYYKDKDYIPATGFTPADIAAEKDGIGYMQVQSDFKVS